MLVRGASPLLSSLPSRLNLWIFSSSSRATTPFSLQTVALFNSKVNNNNHQQRRTLTSGVDRSFGTKTTPQTTNDGCSLISTLIYSSTTRSSISLGLIQPKRGIRFAGKAKPNPARPTPFSESLGKLPFQGLILNPPPIIPRNRSQWNRWKAYFAQQLRNFRFLYDQFGFSVKKAREFKAEATEIYTKYLKALGSQDLKQLGQCIPSERVFDYKKFIVQPNIERELKLLSDFGPVKIINVSHIKGTFSDRKMDTVSILLRITSQQEVDVYHLDNKRNKTFIQKIGPMTITENVIFEKNLLKPKQEQAWKIASVVEQNSDPNAQVK